MPPDFSEEFDDRLNLIHDKIKQIVKKVDREKQLRNVSVKEQRRTSNVILKDLQKSGRKPRRTPSQPSQEGATSQAQSQTDTQPTQQ